MGKETKQTFLQRRYTIFFSCAYCRCTPSSLHLLIVDVHSHTHTHTRGGMGRERRSLTKETLIKISMSDHYLALLFLQECKVPQPPWKKRMAVCCKTKYTLLAQQSNTLLSIYPTEKKTYIHKCSQQLYLYQLKTENNTNVPPKGDWLNEVQYSHILEYYSPTKRNELWIHIT